MPHPPAPDRPADETAGLNAPRKPYLIPAEEPEPRAAWYVAPAGEGDGKEPPGRWLAHVVYLLQSLSFLACFGGVVGMILAALARSGARGTWLQSHFDWQISTFWRSFLYWMPVLVGVVVAISLGVPGKFAFAGAQILMGAWYLGRVAKGWTRLWYGDPMEE
jgi:uncharacterized membrane protein